MSRLAQRTDGMVDPELTCLIADDHPSVLHSVGELLGQWGYTVVATTRNGSDALEQIEQLQPRIALVDLNLPGASGVEIARVAARKWRTAVLIYTGYEDIALVSEALDAGARGFILKGSPLLDLRRALEVVASGGLYVDPVLSGPLLAGAGDISLTQREREVLRLLAGGYSNEEIGAALFISAETVRTHLAKASRKLGARTRTEAVAKALRSGLIT